MRRDTQPSHEIRVLILEDNSADAELMVSALQRAGYDPKWERVENETQFTVRLSADLDLILSDFALPQFSGLRALHLARSRGLDVPFILVSGSIGEETAVQAMREGADDYLLKDRMARIGPAVRQAFEQRRLRADKALAEAALRQSEAKFRALIEQASDGIVVTDTAGCICLANPRYCEMLGYGSDELLGLNIMDTYPAEDRISPKNQNRAVQLGLIDSRGLERRILRKDGTVFLAEISVKSLDGGLHQGIVRDVTERKEQQDGLTRLNRIHAVLSSINSAIVHIRERQELLAEACRIAVDHGGFGMAWVGMVDARTLDIAPVAWAGFEVKEYLGSVRSSARSDHPLGQGVVGRAVRERSTIVSNDLLAEQSPMGNRRSEAIRRGYRSRIALPLQMNGNVIGAIVLFAKEMNFFNADELKLLNELANNVSFALDHIAGQEKIEKLSRVRAVSSEINAAIVRSRNPQELFDETCRIAVEQGKFGLAWIGSFNPETLEVTPAAWAGLGSDELRQHKTTIRADVPQGQGSVGRAIRERKPAFSNDLAEDPAAGGRRLQEMRRLGYRSVVALPLFTESAVVGVLVLFASESDFFTDEELKRLTELADNISFALQAIARQQRIDRLSRIRSVLGGINAAIVRTHTRQELFDEACRIAVQAGGFPFAWLGVVERGSQEIRPVASAGIEGGFLANRSSSRSAGSGHGGRRPSIEAVVEKKAVVVNDVQSDPRITRKQDHKERNINSIAVLPLLIGDDAAGVLGLHAREAGAFDEEEMKLLSELAGDIGFALQTIENREQLDYLSYYDPLTGLPNRSLFIDRTGQQLRARGGEAPMVAVILINLERFRNINETFGRHGGDELLKQVARRLEAALHGKDYLARTAADGFGIVIRGMGEAAAVAHAAESQILACFQQPFMLDDAEVRVAARAGIAMFPADGADADALFKNAEAALKNARASAERYLFYTAEMNARAAQVLSLETRLRKAVEAQQFVLHYQPKIALASGRICGLEALIRWQEPGTGLVPPGTFIPVLEETGLILDVGKWVLTRALADHREWTGRGLTVPRIAVNVSAIQLQQRDFTDMVIETVQQSGAGTGALELEVTESLLMKDVEASIRKLSLLRATGIQIAMDDFGTGYSSLSYVARLPLNSVKIDRSFVRGVGENEHDLAIVTTIIALAHSLKLKVVAEGVETHAQSRLLRLLKCDEAQGFLFSRPVPAAELAPLLRAQGRMPTMPHAGVSAVHLAPPSSTAKPAAGRAVRPSPRDSKPNVV